MLLKKINIYHFVYYLFNKLHSILHNPLMLKDEEK